VNLTVTQTLPESTWRRFVDEHPQGNVFHTPEMFQVFARTAGHQPTLWAALNPQEEPLALLLPVRVTLFGGPLRRLTSRAVAYGSVLCAPGPQGPAALDELLRAYKQAVRGQVLFTELRNLSDLSDLQKAMIGQEFAYEEHLNYLIDLDRPVEEIMQDIGSRTRKNIRRGLRQGEVVITEETISEDKEPLLILEPEPKRREA